MKALVVGGGLAGLTAAYTLKKSGWQVTVLEAGNYAGGRAATVTEKGYTIDLAATQLTSGYKDYLALCKEFGLDKDIVTSSPIVSFMKHGKLLHIDSSKLLTAAFSPVVSYYSKFVLLKTLIDKLTIRPKVQFLDISASYQHDNEGLRDYCLRRLNEEIYDYLIQPIMKGNYLTNPDKTTTLEWFGFMENFASQTMLSINGGANRLVQCLASQVDITFNTPVLHVARENQGVRVHWQEDNEEKSEVVDACVVATRFPEAVNICPEYAAIASELSQRLYYSAATVVNLAYRRATHSKTIGVFVSGKESTDINLVWLDHNKCPSAAPKGHSLITCFVDHSVAGDGSKDDGVVAKVAGDFVEKLFPELKGQQDFARVNRWPLAIPIPEPGTHTAMYHLKMKLTNDSPLQFAGDYFTCTGQNSAIHYGKKAALNLINTKRGEAGAI